MTSLAYEKVVFPTHKWGSADRNIERQPDVMGHKDLDFESHAITEFRKLVEVRSKICQKGFRSFLGFDVTGNVNSRETPFAGR